MTQTDSGAPAAPAEPPLLRRYVGPPGDQVHFLESRTKAPEMPRLYCLHATAYSGRSFRPFLEAMAPRRPVAAPDTPGYGGSDAPADPLDVEGYAAALGAAISEHAGGRPVDILGYHTGAVIAAELARQQPALVRRLVLIGIPFFVGEERQRWREVLARQHALGETLDQFDERWDFFVTRRREGMSLRRGFDNFVDELRAWPDGWWAHEAAFTFDVESCFAAVAQPTLVINPDNHLSEASRRAAAHMPDCRVLELPDLDHAIFDLAPARLAEHIDRFLAADDPTL